MTALEITATAANAVGNLALSTGESQVSRATGRQEPSAKAPIDESIAEVLESIRAVNQKVGKPNMQMP